MYEGPAGSSDKGVPLQLPPDAHQVISTSSFELYQSAQRKEIIIIINPTTHTTEQLHINAVDLEKLITDDSMPCQPQESQEKIPEQAQLYDKTTNWEVYAAAEKIIIKPKSYHLGQLVLTFDDLRILRGPAQPR
jgi:hypothetical protein